MSKNCHYYNTSQQAFLCIIFAATRFSPVYSIMFSLLLKISPLRRHRRTPLLSLPVWRWGYHYLLGLPQGSWTGSLRALQTVDLNLLSVRTKHNKRYCKWKISTMTFFAKLSIRQEVLLFSTVLTDYNFSNLASFTSLRTELHGSYSWVVPLIHTQQWDPQFNVSFVRSVHNEQAELYIKVYHSNDNRYLVVPRKL